jgi:YHS domain-containing protein
MVRSYIHVRLCRRSIGRFKHSGFDNMCTEGLALHKDINTDCSVNTGIGGKTYCFGSEAAKTEFMKDPNGNMAKAQKYYSSTHKKM